MQQTSQLHHGRMVPALRGVGLLISLALPPAGILLWMIGSAKHAGSPLPTNAAATQPRDSNAQTVQGDHTVVVQNPSPSGFGSGCFEGARIRRTWLMNASDVQWIPQENRFEEGLIEDGMWEGCWSLWYADGLFDSGGSGRYEHGIKVESAPSPLGDFGYGSDVR
jgi:hypothetical protein